MVKIPEDQPPASRYSQMKKDNGNNEVYRITEKTAQMLRNHIPFQGTPIKALHHRRYTLNDEKSDN